MEDSDEEADGGPEEHGQTAKVMAVLVQRDHMLLVGWSCNRWGKATSTKTKVVLTQRIIQSLGLLRAPYTSPPGCSFQRQLDFSGKQSVTLQLLREDYSFTYPPLSIAKYSFIQQSELRQRGVNKIVQASKPKYSRMTRDHDHDSKIVIMITALLAIVIVIQHEHQSYIIQYNDQQQLGITTAMPNGLHRVILTQSRSTTD